MVKKAIRAIVLAVIILSFAGCTDEKNTDVSGNDNVLSASKNLSIEDNADASDATLDGSGESTDISSQTNSSSNNEANNKIDALSESLKGKDKSGNSVGEQELSDLSALSQKLAINIAGGSFKETYDMFSQELKPLISELELNEAWYLTCSEIGSFIDLRNVSKETNGIATVVNVILDYDTTGVQIIFSYNSDNKLDGIWFSYAPYESELIVNDDFEETEITFGAKESPISGILTMPKDIKNPPVAILVHGSGYHDADESIGANKPFRDLAHGLAMNGIAVIRYKESTPHNTKVEYTIQDDSLNDVAQAIEYAVNCGRINIDKIIVIGHSLGGMMAPKIAADNKDVDGIVSLAGSPRKLEDIVLDQNRNLLEPDESVTEETFNLYMIQVKTEIQKVKNIKESGQDIILGYPSSYWYSLNQIDIPKIVIDLDIPIFIAQGSADFQVYADIDYVEWQRLLKDKDNVTFQLYDNLNHIFMTSNGRMDTTEYNIKDTVSQKVIDDIAKWILQ